MTEDYPNAVPIAAPVEVTLTSNVVRVEDHPPRSVTTEQTPVTAVLPARLVAERPARVSVTIQPTGADIYVGGAGVTPGTGFRVPVDGSLTVEATCALYAITAAGGAATVYILSQHRDG